MYDFQLNFITAKTIRNQRVYGLHSFWFNGVFNDDRTLKFENFDISHERVSADYSMSGIVSFIDMDTYSEEYEQSIKLLKDGINNMIANTDILNTSYQFDLMLTACENSIRQFYNCELDSMIDALIYDLKDMKNDLNSNNLFDYKYSPVY